MQIVGSPLPPNVSASANTPLPLQPGQVVDAVVLALRNDLVRLMLPTGVIDVRAEAQLVPGSTVRLAVEGDAANLKLVIIDRGSSAAGQGPGQTPAPQTGTPQAMPSQAVAPALVPVLRGQGSGPAQGRSASTPASATAASVDDGEPTVSQPAMRAAIPAAAPPDVAAAKIAPRVATPAAALAEAVRSAASRQDGLAPLMADVEALTTAGTPVPPAVRQAAAALLGLRVGLDQDFDGDDLKQAFARSGLFLESRLAAADGGRPIPVDLKSALTVFREVLRAWTGGMPAGMSDLPDPAMPGAAAKAAAQPPIPALPDAAGQAAAPAAPARAPLPPLPEGATAGQAPVASTIMDEASPRAAAERLIAGTEAALARHTLLQAASLPEVVRDASPDAGPRWTFDIPFVTPQGTAVVQFAISRDQRRGGKDDKSRPAYRAKFSLDLEPLGPVHAQIALTGDRATVSLWAERQETARALAGDADVLAQALREAALEPGDIDCHVGAPRSPLPRAGHFLDRAT